ncbi:DNA-processing protein DprA [Fulvivirga ligni]|uniref:DNA-processing protein DprA n=1 Tax=Fulvivirga ligni TaxID=2904246 RepID=UPI001F333D0D|nr:DNA-processing protein DprA [Fulvivirga ligni]UII19303.1 DNA-processing protein DprA [Fulvivirga ligni]
MDQNRLSQLALNFIPGIGSYSIKQLVSYAGSASNVFQLTKSRLLKIPGIGKVTSEAILNNKPLEKAEQELKRAEQANIKILLYTDAEFPKRLKQINDAPSLLYYKGNSDLNTSKIVAIVGTRNASEYGKEVTQTIIEKLKQHNTLIVSGLAYGIDIQAHKHALKNNLPTIGVMASGVNIVYPALHKQVAIDMTEKGGLISEHPLDTKPEPHRFPARNRIIAGMSDAIIIVEAAKKGGALITAEIANSYNKDVFAVPGKIADKYSQGCNNLIKSNKAHLMTGVEDLEYIMNWQLDDEVPETVIDLENLSKEERQVILELKNENNSILIDNLSWKTNIPVNQLSSILLSLEFQGLVKTLPGKRYQSV